MKTIGIDMAVQPEDTAVCVLEWDNTRAAGRFQEGTNDVIAGHLRGDAHIGFDVPLGWPKEFVLAVTAHALQTSWVSQGACFEDDYAGLRLRRTDRAVKELLKEKNPKLQPLSVSLDKLGAPAIRAAWLLANVEGVDRTGQTGRVLEVYPAASLTEWNMVPRRSYKSNKAESREELVRLTRELFSAIPWLEMEEGEDLTEHEFDALICALTAAAHHHQPRRVDTDQLEAARAEGWIQVPSCTLSDLDPRE